MSWFKRNKTGIEKSSTKNVKVPEGLWTKCPGCSESVLSREIADNLQVCPKCGHHYRILPRKRLQALLDEGTWQEYDAGMTSVDFLQFKDSKSYQERIDSALAKGGSRDAVVCVEGSVEGTAVQVAVFDFSFMGGSMGSVVGEKITRAIERGVQKRQPVIIVSASGGARMQESILSLMQMAKTSAALAKLKDAGLPFISILTDPTTGGVTASFAMLGDVNIAEPKALIGFAGPRVIEQTLRQKLPDGFQRAEYLLEHGMVDVIVPRTEMRQHAGADAVHADQISSSLRVRFQARLARTVRSAAFHHQTGA
jgi:acetyl-CoA carboxylase carboxyl transferase subunit beta